MLSVQYGAVQIFSMALFFCLDMLQLVSGTVR